MSVVYIGVGSNIDPTHNVPSALDELSARGIRIVASSRFYRTAPIGRPEQFPYANGVWRTETETEPLRLKTILREVEQHLGRVRTDDKFAPRSIDLDILLYGQLSTHDEALLIPDPHILERPFLSLCLLELDPDIRLPGSSDRLRELSRVEDTVLEEYSEITRAIRAKLEVQR